MPAPDESVWGTFKHYLGRATLLAIVQYAPALYRYFETGSFSANVPDLTKCLDAIHKVLATFSDTLNPNQKAH